MRLGIRWLLGGVLLLGAIAQPLSAAKRAIWFTNTARKTQDGTHIGEVSANDTVILRLRSKTDANIAQRAEEVAERLQDAAVGGVTAADIVVQASGATATVAARGQTLVTVDAETARLSGTRAQALARQWAETLKTLLSGPYMAVAATDLVVPYGETRSMRVGGTALGDITAVSADEDVAETLADNTDGRITVWGHGIGQTRIHITRSGFEAEVDVQVRKWAAQVLGEPSAYVTGGEMAPDIITKVALNAVRTALRPEPGAHVHLSAPSSSEIEPTSVSIQVSADGPGFLPLRCVLPVRVYNRQVPRETADRLLVSNDPENIRRQGLLCAGTLWPREPTRILYHHRNAVDRGLYLIMSLANTGDTTASVHVIESVAGPATDELFVGHLAAARFIADGDRCAGYILNVPPGRSCEISSQFLPPGTIGSGLFRLNILEGAQMKVLLKCAERRSGTDNGWFPALPPGMDQLPFDGRWVFPGKRKIHAEYTVGDNWAFIGVGKHPSRGEQGETLHGDYGVMYYVTAVCSNPTTKRVRLELAFRSGGGPARGILRIDGQIIETGVVPAGAEELVWRSWLDPRTRRRINIRTLPEPASTYPIQLILRSRS